MTLDLTPGALHHPNGQMVITFMHSKLHPNIYTRSNQLTGDIGLEAKFSAGTGAYITLIVLSEEPATF